MAPVTTNPVTNSPHAGLKLLDEFQIKPSSSSSIPLPSTPTSISLPFFDLPWVSWFYFKPIYFYEFDQLNTQFLQTTLPRLKTSLAFALQHFYPLAGSLTWPQHSNKPEIVCSDGDSVSVIVVESDKDFHHLCGNHAKDVNEFETLIPKFSPSMSTHEKLIPLLALQITFFPNKGMSIGFNFHHVVVDGRAASNFISSWASICKLGDVENSIDAFPVPCLDRSIVKDPKAMELKYVNGGIEQHIIKKEKLSLSNMPTRSSPVIDTVRATFVMGRSEIKKLKELVSNRTTPPLQISTFGVTLAYVWVCLIKARWGECDVSDEIEHLLSPVDCRARLDPPLPQTYFGNCLGTFEVKAKRSELLGEDGIVFAAKLIGKEIQYINECVWNALEKGVFYIKTLPRDKLLITAGSPKFGVYDTDFGWGKPKKFEVCPLDGAGASISECPNEGGIEVGLVRKKIEMEAFALIFKETMQDLA